MTGVVTNNEAESRYELDADGGTATAEYVRRGDVVVFTHTMVPAALRGRGIGDRLIEAALADVRERGLRILPECAFVAAYVTRHAEVRDLVAN